ncbi:MAG: cytochrome c oxidase assembly protein [Chloroflexota bacterium]|nr:cytochrome c oxidase assembly protein [Chloroflexota bacterium]
MTPSLRAPRHWGGRTRGAAAAAAVALLTTPGAVLGHGASVDAPTWPGILFEWRSEPLVLLGLGLSLVVWLLLARRVANRHPLRPHPRWRSAAFIGALVVIAIALTSPIEAYEGQLFSVHMLQHMLLQLVAAPLLLLGAPMTLALRAAPPPLRRWLLNMLRSRVVAVVSFPLLAWVLFAAVNWGWHFSDLYDQALESPWLHDLEHATFLGAAILFWLPVIGADPARWRLHHPVRLFYLFLAMPQNSFLGVALMSAQTVLYPHYLTNGRVWGPSALVDQNVGGMLMWVGGDVVFLLAMGLILAAWVRAEDRRSAREDARLDAQLIAGDRARAGQGR